MKLVFGNNLFKIYSFGSKEKGYILLKDNQSIMIDCPNFAIKDELDFLNLPYPEFILHTHIQEEHCFEWREFANAKVVVANPEKEIAKRSEKYFSDCKVVWSKTREWDSRGEETYGIGGAVITREPQKALNVVEILEVNNVWTWNDLEIEVISLVGHGKHSIGFYLRKYQIVFCGDLLINGGFLVNFQDLERGYEIDKGYREIIKSLNYVKNLQIKLALPSTGEVIEDFYNSCNTLLEKLDDYVKPKVFRANLEQNITNIEVLRKIGRYNEVIKNVYQNNNFGNVILFIDKNGNGFMVDPGFCVWIGWDEEVREFNADLDMLEKEAGLKRIEYAFFTHYHGDHVQFANILKERYQTTTITTNDIAKRLEYPEEFNLACLINWYNFTFQNLEVDKKLNYNEKLKWHDVDIEIFHTPGHCLAHAGLFLKWQGKKIACTGDTFVYGNGPISTALPILYNESSYPNNSSMPTLEQLKKYELDYIFCGHSHSHKVVDPKIFDEFLEVVQSQINKASKLINGKF